MTGAVSLRFTAQMQADIARMMREMLDMNRQVASGSRANDLGGFGSAAGRLINTQSMIANIDSRAGITSQLGSRFGLQAAALSRAAETGADLAKAIKDAIAADDGRMLETDLDVAFGYFIGAMNESWNGQPLFAGQRQAGGAIRINTLDQLVAATTPGAIFNESKSPQYVDVGSGTPLKLADLASDLSNPMFDAMRELKILLNANGGTLPEDLNATLRDQLQIIAAGLDRAAAHITAAEGRTGQMMRLFETEEARLTARGDLLRKELGEQADADVAAISIHLAALTAQYEATAKSFAEISRLTLLDYI